LGNAAPAPELGKDRRKPVSQKILSLLGVFLLVVGATILAQEAPPPQAPPVPAASRADIDCSGFIASSNLPENMYLLDGADNDFHMPLKQYSTGDRVFLRYGRETNVAEGAEYALVRSGRQIFETSWYRGEHASLRSLGKAYQDAGRVKVIRVAPEGAVAEVTFACGAIYPGDIAVPYQPRPIPEYTPTKDFDRFALPNGKMLGAISASRNNVGILGNGSIAYINLGESDGVKAGQRFRIFRIKRERIEGLYAIPAMPRESVGEMVILSTQEKSSVGIIVMCLREVFLGDGIELE
jgi:hypothetical protein